MRIGIIGAGLSGLATARTLLGDGCEVVVFEKEDEAGGVWARSRRYPGLSTQNPRDTYAFSDFPMPPHYPDWPSGEQVQAYLAAYADRFGVAPHVRLRTRVISAEARTDGRPGWRIRAAGDAGESVDDVDWLIVCNGVFSEPHIPDLPGRDAFEAASGRVLHTTQVGDGSVLAGKRVAVVGFAKSAADVACTATGLASGVTLVFRRAMWKMPQRFFGRIHLKYVLTTRFSESLFRYRELAGFERVMHGPARRAVAMLWRTIERSLRRRFALDEHGLTPETPLDQLVACSLSLASNGFYDHVQAGRIQLRRGQASALRVGAVEMEDGGSVDADVVVFGTGFRQEVPFLPHWATERIRGADGCFRLYRNILPVDVPRLAFVGYNSSLYSQLTSEIGARWMAEHVHGRLPLPAQPEMRRRIESRLAWLKAERPDALAAGVCVVPFNFHYINDLLRDMGARTWRTRNRLCEYLMPVDPSIYADLKAELEQKRQWREVPREPALGLATGVATDSG